MNPATAPTPTPRRAHPPGGTTAADQARTPFTAVRPATTGHLRLLTVGEISLELDALRVKLPCGRHPTLNVREFNLLKTLMENAGRVMTHRELAAGVWGPEREASAKAVSVLMRALRGKLEPESHGHGQYRYIQTVHAYGYVFARGECGPWPTT
jgi:DNA-binding response OmpR family regulator